MAIKHNKTLDYDEFFECMERYSKVTGDDWVMTRLDSEGIENQDIWVAAFEQAKEYFADNSTISKE